MEPEGVRSSPLPDPFLNIVLTLPCIIKIFVLSIFRLRPVLLYAVSVVDKSPSRTVPDQTYDCT